MRRFSRLAFATAVASAITSAARPPVAGAQSNCAPANRASISPSLPRAGLLAKPVSLHGRGISLREALDRVAATAGVRLSYSAELLDLSRPVCIEYEFTPLGQVLEELLAEASLRPVVLGGDQIVLTPVAPRDAGSVQTSPILKSVGMLDRVVVTGSTIGASQRALPVALDVIAGQQLAQRGVSSISGALDGVVPGLWVWEQSPLNLLARYGSIRGASSFGVSYPKVYVDGIEVANSLLVTHLDPESVSRIEVIRGPQGAALYGADAISGVMNIVTRQDGVENGEPKADIRTQGGTSSSDYSASNVLTQSHSVSLRTGTNVKSARLGGTVSTMGAFIPGASSQQVSASGGLRFVRPRAVINGTFRFFAQDTKTPTSPLLDALQVSSPMAILDSSNRQSVRELTIGTSGIFAQNERWTHSAVAGMDGYTLESGAMGDGAFPSPLDSALRAATGNAVRTTLRASSVGQFGNISRTAATITIAAEHSFVHDETVTMSASPKAGAGLSTSDRYALAESRSNAGVIGQVSASFRESLFLTGGLRIERNTGLVGVGDIATLPMLGASLVRSFPIGTLKVRAAFGRGIRPPQTSNRSGLLMGIGGTPSPEEQTGIEAGADFFFGTNAVLHATHFDQRASGLIQPVSVYNVTSNENLPRYRRLVYELQNVGEITNRGWELSGSVGDGPWSLGGTFSQVDSRVRKLASLYTGDLRPGDRMLEVPARTFGMNAGYAKGRLSMSWRVSRASDWVNYDRLSLLSAFATENSESGDFVGPELRSYWKQYSGVTRVGGRVGLTVSRGMSLMLDGENLLDEQRGEPDNITVLPGRTLSAGLRVRF
jgi:iron complex outermembrane recepter protein